MPVKTNRVLMAERLMDEAEHGFTEVAMRASLTRAYYAMHHLGIALTQETNHGLIRNALKARNASLGEEYEYFLNLRQRADYDPDWVQRRTEIYNGSA